MADGGFGQNSGDLPAFGAVEEVGEAKGLTCN
jgi:hypothetical protein